MVSKLSEIWSGLFSPDPHLWSVSWFFYPFRIVDPGVKKAPDPGSGSATQLTNVSESGLGATPCWTCCRCPCCPPPPSPYTTGTAPPRNRTRHAQARKKWMGTRDRRRNFMPLDGKACLSLGCLIAALLWIYAQISTWRGHGMRQHVLSGWEPVIMPMDGKAWIWFWDAW